MRCSRLALTSCRQGLSSRPRRRRGTRDKVRGGEERLLKTHLGGRGGGWGGLPQSCAPFPVGLWEPGGMQAGWSSRDGASRELRGEGREAQSAESSHPQCPPPPRARAPRRAWGRHREHRAASGKQGDRDVAFALCVCVWGNPALPPAPVPGLPSWEGPRGHREPPDRDRPVPSSEGGWGDPICPPLPPPGIKPQRGTGAAPGGQ